MLSIEDIKNQVGCNAPATEAQIQLCNLKLRQSNLPELPVDYAYMLKICNGFSNEDAAIFGADVKDNNWYEDIAEFNITYFRGKSAEWLILGEDDFFFFIYDARQKRYYIADRDTFDEEFSSADFILPVEYILKVE